MTSKAQAVVNKESKLIASRKRKLLLIIAVLYYFLGSSFMLIGGAWLAMNQSSNFELATAVVLIILGMYLVAYLLWMLFYCAHSVTITETNFQFSTLLRQFDVARCQIDNVKVDITGIKFKRKTGKLIVRFIDKKNNSEVSGDVE